jgi:hypothetical protein
MTTAQKTKSLSNFNELTTSQKKRSFLVKLKPVIKALIDDTFNLVNLDKKVRSFDDYLWNIIRSSFSVQSVEQNQMIREFIADSYQWTVKRKGKGKETDNRTKQPSRFSQFFSDIKRAFENGIVPVENTYKQFEILENGKEDKKKHQIITIYQNVFDNFQTIGELRKALNAHTDESRSEQYNHIEQNWILIKLARNKAEKAGDSKTLSKIDKVLNDARRTLNLAPKAIESDKTNKIVDSE